MRKFLLAIFITLLSYLSPYAETFVVTSNDSGSGTLREAIEKAVTNGTAEQDYIR